MNKEGEDQKTQVKAQFNAIVADYDAGPGCFRHFGLRLATAAGIEAGHKVLDVASGRGAVLFPVAARTSDVTGVDLAEDMVRATNEEAARQGLKAQVRVMDAEHLDFPDATFDHVLCGFGIMFFPDQDLALREFWRVLKPGGQLGVSTWRVDQTSELKAVMNQLGMAPPRRPGWISEANDLSNLLQHAGFTKVQVDEESHPFRYTDIEQYWMQARGTGMRRVLDNLGAADANRVRAALAERFSLYRQSDGFYVPSSALLAFGHR